MVEFSRKNGDAHNRRRTCEVDHKNSNLWLHACLTHKKSKSFKRSCGSFAAADGGLEMAAT